MLIVVVLSAFSEAPMVAGESAGFRFSRLTSWGANGSIYTNFGVHPCDYGILGLIGLSINRVLVLSALH
jgi:hypothetical protein